MEEQYTVDMTDVERGGKIHRCFNLSAIEQQLTVFNAFGLNPDDISEEDINTGKLYGEAYTGMSQYPKQSFSIKKKQ